MPLPCVQDADGSCGCLAGCIIARFGAFCVALWSLVPTLLPRMDATLNPRFIACMGQVMIALKRAYTTGTIIEGGVGATWGDCWLRFVS